MNAGLAYLLHRTARGRVRLLGRRMRTAKGAFGIVVTALLLIAFAAAQVWMLFDPVLRAEAVADAQVVREMTPPLLVVLTLLGLASGRALYFTAPEVDFLFPAPVGRRELLLYNVISRLGIQVFSGVWTALFVMRYAPEPVIGLLAVILGFVFVYVSAQVLGVATIAAEEWLPPAARRSVRFALVAALASIVIAGMATADPAEGLGGRLRAFATSPVVRATSFVTRPFGEMFVAESADAALGWAAVCLGIVAAEIGVMMALDVAYTERSLAVSRRAHERLKRIAAGGGVAAAAPPTKVRVRVPRFVLLGRSGVLAWRQLTEVVRSPRGLAGPVVVLAVWVGIMSVSAGSGDRDALAVALVSMCLVLPMFFGAQLGFDFRRDLDRIPYLRSLPLAPTAVAVGQLVPVVLVLVAMEYALVAAAVAAGGGGVPGRWLAAVVLAVPPFVWAMAALDNLLFLLMPYRLHPGGQNYQFLGKSMLAMLVKLLVIGAMALGGALAAGAVYWLTDSMTAAVAAGVAAFSLGCVPLTWGVGRAFAAFDASVDVG